jgi:hypothetical protein
VVFEAAVLIYCNVFYVLKLFPQKARGSRGRDPEEPPRGGGDERPRACYTMGARLLFNMLENYNKTRRSIELVA